MGCWCSVVPRGGVFAVAGAGQSKEVNPPRNGYFIINRQPTMSDACLATAVPLPIPIPMSARTRAGASGGAEG